MNNNSLNVIFDDERWNKKISDVEDFANKVFDTALKFLSKNP